MRNFLRRLALIGAMVVATVISYSAQAADWPERPITMVIMSKEGGGMDRASRLVGDAMAAKLGQPMKYVNRPGASGEIALQSFLNSKDDGYTVFSGNIPTLMVMYGSADKDYKMEDLAWLGAYLEDPALLITHNDSGIGSVKDFITAAQSSPQRVGVANWASVQTLALLQLIEQKGLQVEIIPYSGFKKASTALLGGHIEAAVGNYAAVNKLGENVKTLAIFAEEVPGGAEIVSINSIDGADVIYAASVRALGVHDSLKSSHPDRYEVLNSTFSEIISDPAFVESFPSIGASTSQSITWGESEADTAGEAIIELIDEVGDTFKQRS